MRFEIGCEKSKNKNGLQVVYQVVYKHLQSDIGLRKLQNLVTDWDSDVFSGGGGEGRS